MAGSLTTSEANSVLDDLFYTPTVYAALCDASPGDAGDMAGQELAASYGYERTAMTFGTQAAARSISISADLTFPAASGGDWGTVTHLAICTAAVEGVDDAKAWGPLTVSKLVEDADQLKFASGNVTVSFAAG